MGLGGVLVLEDDHQRPEHPLLGLQGGGHRPAGRATNAQLGQERRRVGQHLQRVPLQHETQFSRGAERHADIDASPPRGGDAQLVALEDHGRCGLVAHDPPHLIEDGAERVVLGGGAENHPRHLEQALVEDAPVLLARVQAHVLESEADGRGQRHEVARVVGGEAAGLVEDVQQGHDPAVALDGGGEDGVDAALLDRRIVERVALGVVGEMWLPGLDDLRRGRRRIEGEAILGDALGAPSVGGPAGHDLAPGAVVEGEVAALGPHGRGHAAGHRLVAVPDLILEEKQGRVCQLQRFAPCRAATARPAHHTPKGNPCQAAPGGLLAAGMANPRGE